MIDTHLWDFYFVFAVYSANRQSEELGSFPKLINAGLDPFSQSVFMPMYLCLCYREITSTYHFLILAKHLVLSFIIKGQLCAYTLGVLSYMRFPGSQLTHVDFAHFINI